MTNLFDRGTIEAVTAPIDWKYALRIKLTEPSFNSYVLILFRSRLLNGGKEKLILDKLLEPYQQLQLIKAITKGYKRVKTWSTKYNQTLMLSLNKTVLNRI